MKVNFAIILAPFCVKKGCESLCLCENLWVCLICVYDGEDNESLYMFNAVDKKFRRRFPELNTRRCLEYSYTFLCASLTTANKVFLFVKSGNP